MRSRPRAVSGSRSIRSSSASRRVEGSRPRPSAPGGEQLLGEERVAFAALEEALDHLGVGGGAEDVGELGGDLAAVEGAELEPPHPPPASQLGEQRPHRVAAVQLVGAVGDHGQQPALVGQAGGEEGEEAAGRVVGPVGVVEPEDHRRLPRPSFRAALSSASKGRWRSVVGVDAGGVRVDLRDQLREPGRVAGERRSRTRSSLADQAAQRRDQRRVGELVAAELDALAADRAAAPFAGAVDEGVEEAGLADPRLARQERQRGRPAGGLVERSLELGELAGPSDQPAGTDSGRHPAIIAVRSKPRRRLWSWRGGPGRDRSPRPDDASSRASSRSAAGPPSPSRSSSGWGSWCCLSLGV